MKHVLRAFAAVQAVVALLFAMASLALIVFGLDGVVGRGARVGSGRRRDQRVGDGAGRAVQDSLGQSGQQRRRRRADDEWSVHAEFPMPVRIGPAELAALEAYLGAEIDAILASPSTARSSSPTPTWTDQPLPVPGAGGKADRCSQIARSSSSVIAA